MGAAIRRRRSPHATLRQIERGVFHALDPDGGSVRDIGGVRAYRNGASAADAGRAVALTDDTFGIDWTEAFITRLFASDAKIAL
jgi:hypothetical protein